MSPFEVIMVVSATTLILVTLLLFVVRTMPTRPGIDWWAASAVLQSITNVLAILFYGHEKAVAGDIIYFNLQILVSHFIAIGAVMFLGKRVPLKRWLLAIALSVLAVDALLLSGQQFASEVMFAVTNSIAFAILSVLLYKNEWDKTGAKILSIFCVIITFHWLDYPILSHVEWFAPIGFMIGMTFALGIYMLLAILALLQFRDFTKQSEERAIHLATHDPLTGLYNRSYLDTLYDDYVEEANASSASFSLLYLDLDGFKSVNDTFGHKAGDMVLVTIARRIEEWLGNKGEVIRIGGDEIIVLGQLSGKYCNDGTYQFARALLDTIEQPIVDRENTYDISASIGVCSYQSGIKPRSLNEMISVADEQMYKAKSAGGRCIFIREVQKDDLLKKIGLSSAGAESPKVRDYAF